MSLFSSEQALPCFDEKRLTVHLQKAYKIEIIMRKRNFLILLLLSGLWPVIGVSAQDAWKITAEQIEPSSYYGITVANGMLGLVSSPDPLKISRVVLGGFYDIYGKGRVNNFLHGINMLDTELQINGTKVKASQIYGGRL